MSKCNWLVGVLAAAALAAGVLPASGEKPAGAWHDNERKFKSTDPAHNFRRSEHFRISWGKGAAKDKNANNDFPRVTEDLAQGNLQMLEQLWHLLHDPVPKGMGFHIPGRSANPKHRDGKNYRANLMMNNTGNWLSRPKPTTASPFAQMSNPSCA